jgi:hypothetical protein
MITSPYQPAFYLTPFMSPSAPFNQPDMIPGAGSAGAEDERTRLLEKVSNVLPDINRLLHHYQETQGLLSEKDTLVRQPETQHEEEITRLRIELSATKEEYEKIIGEQASENVKLKGNLAEHAEKIGYLEQLSQESANAKEELAELLLKHKSLEGEAETARSLNNQLVTEKRALEVELEQLKEQAFNDRIQYDRELGALNEVHERQLEEKGSDYTRSLNDQKSGLSKMQLDLAGMITKHAQQKKELDFARATILEQENSLATNRRETADALLLRRIELDAWTKATAEKAQQHKQEMSRLSQQLAESRAQHDAEVDSLRKSHEKEINEVQHTVEDLRNQLVGEAERHEAQVQTEREAARSAIGALQGDLSKEHDAHASLKAELAAEREAHERLRAQHDKRNQHHAELAESMLNLRTKQAEWQRESERMDQILQSLGRLGSHHSTGKGDDPL